MVRKTKSHSSAKKIKQALAKDHPTKYAPVAADDDEGDNEHDFADAETVVNLIHSFLYPRDGYQKEVNVQRDKILRIGPIARALQLCWINIGKLQR